MKQQMKETYNTLYHMFSSWKIYNKFFPEDYLPKVEGKTLKEAYEATKEVHKTQEFNDFYETLKMLIVWRGLHGYSALSSRVHECLNSSDINRDHDFENLKHYFSKAQNIDGFFTKDSIGRYMHPLCYCIDGDNPSFIIENVFKKINNISSTEILNSFFRESGSDDGIDFLYNVGGVEFFSCFLCNPLFESHFTTLGDQDYNNLVYNIANFLDANNTNIVLAIETVLCKSSVSPVFKKLWRAAMNTFMYRKALQIK